MSNAVVTGAFLPPVGTGISNFPQQLQGVTVCQVVESKGLKRVRLGSVLVAYLSGNRYRKA